MKFSESCKKNKINANELEFELTKKQLKGGGREYFEQTLIPHFLV